MTHTIHSRINGPATFNVLALLTLLFASSPVMAENNLDWPSWRGPQAIGSIDTGSYPDSFGPKTCRWSSPLPGKGCSTPIVLKRKIYVTAPVDGNDAVLCFDAQGAEQWRTTFDKENAGKHRNGSGSNPSPVTDGNAVFVNFKSGTLAGIELNGSIRWQTNLVQRFGKDTLFWDHGTSPVLTEKHVVMARMHKGESWLAAFNKSNGDMAWKVDRNYNTPVECDHGYSTPLVFRFADKEAILVWGAEHVTIHDAANGSKLWSCGNFNPDGSQLWPAIATPVIIDDMAVIAYGRNDRGIPRLHGIRLAGSGDVTKSNHVWKRDDVGTFVPTPSVHQGRVIVVGDQGEVECLEPKTGKTIWKDRFPKNRNKFYASPLIAGNRLYAPREDGVVFVAEIENNQFRVLAENDMGESIIGSPVPFGDAILLRGIGQLFCAAGKKGAE